MAGPGNGGAADVGPHLPRCRTVRVVGAGPEGWRTAICARDSAVDL